LKILVFKFGCDHVIRVLVENTLRNLRTNSGKKVQRKCTKIEMNGMAKIGEKNTVSIRASGCHESPAFSTFYTLIFNSDISRGIRLQIHAYCPHGASVIKIII
jgi:hypothetical protein